MSLRNRRSRKDSPPLSRRISRRRRTPGRPAESSVMRFVSRGRVVSFSRIEQSIAFSIRSVPARDPARSMIVRAAEVTRTPSRDSRSAVLQFLVVCRWTCGSSDRRIHGTTNSIRSPSKPSSPHHCAAERPNSAASRPSAIAPARTRNSQVAGVARCRNTRSAIATQTPSSTRSHHCWELRPHAATSSRVMRWCCVWARSINRRSVFTSTQSDIEIAEAEGETSRTARVMTVVRTVMTRAVCRSGDS